MRNPFDCAVAVQPSAGTATRKPRRSSRAVVTRTSSIAGRNGTPSSQSWGTPSARSTWVHGPSGSTKWATNAGA